MIVDYQEGRLILDEVEIEDSKLDVNKLDVSVMEVSKVIDDIYSDLEIGEFEEFFLLFIKEFGIDVFDNKVVFFVDNILEIDSNLEVCLIFRCRFQFFCR